MADESAGSKKEEAKSDGPKWVRDTAAFVALLSTIVGVVLSIYELRQKSEADRETARANRDIAAQKAETDLTIAREQQREQERQYEYQRQQHTADQTYVEQKDQREQRALQGEHLAQLISDMLAGGTKAEGDIDLLQSYVLPDHRYDAIVGNAVLAEMDQAQNDAEVSLSLKVLERLPELETLLKANQEATQRFQTAFMDVFWIRFSADLKGHGVDLSREQPPEQSTLVEALGEAENDTTQPFKVRVQQDPERPERSDSGFFWNYLDALLYARIGQQWHYLKEASPPPWYAGEWRGLVKQVQAVRSGSQEEAMGRAARAATVMKATSHLLLAALLAEGASRQRAIHLTGAYLFAETWKKGKYPLVDFDNAFIEGGSDFSEVDFNMESWKSLARRVVVKNTGNAKEGYFSIFGRAVSLTDLKVPPQVAGLKMPMDRRLLYP